MLRTGQTRLFSSESPLNFHLISFSLLLWKVGIVPTGSHDMAALKKRYIRFFPASYTSCLSHKASSDSIILCLC